MVKLIKRKILLFLASQLERLTSDELCPCCHRRHTSDWELGCELEEAEIWVNNALRV